MVSADRSQLLLVAGFLVAVTIVFAAVLVNAFVIPGDLETGAESAEIGDVVRSHDPVQSDLQRVFGHATSQDKWGEPLPYADPSEFRAELENGYGRPLSGLRSTRVGAVVAVSHVPANTTRGDAVLQRQPNELNGPGGATDWEIARAVDPLVRLEANLTERDGSTELNVTGAGGDVWTLTLEDAAIQVSGPGITDRSLCDASVAGEAVALDVTGPSERNASVRVPTANETCDPFAFGGDRPQPWTLDVTDGNATNGTYVVTFDGLSFVTTNTSIADSIDDGEGIPPGSRSATHWPVREANVVIEPGLRVEFVGTDLRYESAFTLYERTGR